MSYLSAFGLSEPPFIKEIQDLEKSWETAPYQLRVDWPGKQPPVIEDHSMCEYVVSERAFHVSARVVLVPQQGVKTGAR